MRVIIINNPCESKKEFRNIIRKIFGNTPLSPREELELYASKEVCLMADNKIEIPKFIINPSFYDKTESGDKARASLKEISEDIFDKIMVNNMDSLEIYIIREIIKSKNIKLCGFIFKSPEDSYDF